MLRPPAKFCRTCGQTLQSRVPTGDDRPRQVCAGCGHIDYDNPTVIVGCLVERVRDDDHEILLCKRAIEPAHGRWTLPAGFLEIGEGLAQGAARETLEEANIRVEVTGAHCQLDLPHIGQTYALFAARALEELTEPGSESLECRWFAMEQIPWSELSFPSVHFALQLWQQDRQQRRRRMHTAMVRWSGSGSRWDAGNYALEAWLQADLR